MDNLKPTNDEGEDEAKGEQANNEKPIDEPGAQGGNFTGRADILTNSLENIHLVIGGDSKDPQVRATNGLK